MGQSMREEERERARERESNRLGGQQRPSISTSPLYKGGTLQENLVCKCGLLLSIESDVSVRRAVRLFGSSSDV